MDLSSLAKASVKGKLPKLTNLDLSCNEKCVGHFQQLFSGDQKWGDLLTLNLMQDVESTEDFQIIAPAVHSGALGKLQNLTLSTNNNDTHVLSCVTIKWLNLLFLHVHCACTHGPSDHVKLFQQISKAVETGVFPQLHVLRVSSNFKVQHVDPDRGFQLFKDLRETSKAREYLNTLARSSASLLAKCRSCETDQSYLHYLEGLTRIKAILGESHTEEYSVLGQWTGKIALIASFSGTLPDLQTVCSLLHEAVDNSPDISDTRRPYYKSLGDAVCTNLYSWFYCRSCNWQEMYSTI